VKALRRLTKRIAALRSRSGREKQLADEIEFHIQMQTEENLRTGMPPEEARRAAVLQFGGVESVKDRYRDQQGLPFLENLIADLRYAVRGCRRSPGFTLTAVSMLALGIGATTAIFSIVNAALLKPLQLHEPDRLLLLLTGGDYGMVLSPLKFAHFRKQTAVLENVSAFDFNGVVNYKGDDSAEQWQSLQLSADGFNCLGIRVVQGRTYTVEEDLPNAPKVAVISQGLWAQRFGSDPGILGRAVTLNDELYTVIGVVEDSEALKHDFGTSDFPQVYLPMQLDPNSHDEGNYFQAMARLKPGVSLAQARARLKASGADLRASARPNVSDADLMNFFNAMPLRDALVSDYRILFAILLSAVGFVLLIACANVANLLLARAAGRTREIAIRSAIGADRWRVIRQLMTESLLLSSIWRRASARFALFWRSIHLTFLSWEITAAACTWTGA
jgi:putative ABC transport system permease protein